MRWWTRALSALKRLTHRGGVDADGASGDGAGLLTALPLKFLYRQAAQLGISLPGCFGLGMVFLPHGEEARVQREIERIAREMDLVFLGWRAVPVNPSIPGARAAETMPSVWQCFFAPQAGEVALNSEFVRVQPCSDEEDAALRQLLIRHNLHTGSPRAAFILNSAERLPFVRVQPERLPCSIEQTWNPVLERLQPASFRAAAANKAWSAALPGMTKDAGEIGHQIPSC
jgi:glutamate synthase domain-containing protein 1